MTRQEVHFTSDNPTGSEAGNPDGSLAEGRGPAIILVRPQLAENIGMAARAMLNFGLRDLRLVAPREGWPQKKRLKKGAVQAASGASDILATAQVFESVQYAIADLHFVYATTARLREMVKPVLLPEAAIGETKQRIAAGQGVGILFGPERTGLDNDDVSLSDAILTFPVNPQFSSLNLAQAVLLIGYEWFKPGGEKTAPFQPPEATPAKRETLVSFFDYVEGALDSAGYLSQTEKRPVIVRNLRNIFHRMAMSEQDVKSLRGAFRALVRAGQAVPARPQTGGEE